MDETNPHSTTATVHDESEKVRTDGWDDNDDRGPEKRTRRDEVCTKHPFPLDLTIADQATCKPWYFVKDPSVPEGAKVITNSGAGHCGNCRALVAIRAP